MAVILFKETYNDIEQYKEYYVVTRDDKYGIVSKTDGSVVIPMEYEALIPVGEDKIVVQKGDKYGIIDIKGNVILPIEYDKIRPIEKKRLFYREIKFFAKKGDTYKSYKLNELESGNYD